MLERWQILAIISSVISIVLLIIALYFSYLLGQRKGYSMGYREGKRDSSRTTDRRRVNLYDGDNSETIRVAQPMPAKPVYINRRFDDAFND